MAQHDYNIENQTGLEFRADLNNMAEAIVTQNSGPTEPTVTYAGMKWLDTSTSPPIEKRRNAANSAWETTLTEAGRAVAGAADAAAQRSAIGAQAALVSGTNIKTVGGQSLLGSGDLTAGLSAASTAEAQAGTSNTVAITPLRLREGLNASGSAPVYACRAWVNFNGTLSHPITPRASGNVSSVTKHGTGDYTINFTTAMLDANYAAMLTYGGTPNSFIGRTYEDASARTASSVRVALVNTSFALQDAAQVSVAVFS